MTLLEISARELNESLKQATGPCLIDCREPWENEHACLPGSTLVPMNDTPNRLEELRQMEGQLVVYCHHGIRSRQVVEWLHAQGLTNSRSLAGGIDAWSLEIDPDMPRY